MTNKKSKQRLFPRYDISKLPFTINLFAENEEFFDHKEITALDVSVSGIRIKSNLEIEIPSTPISAVIKSENFNFKIPFFCVWTGSYPDNSTHYGFHFSFDDIKVFNGWLGFIKALHYLSLKSPYKLPDVVNRHR